MSDMLFVGSGESIPKPCCAGLITHPSGTQFITTANSIVKLNSRGNVVSFGLLTEPIAGLNFFGISIAPWDIIKGLIFGLATRFGVEPMFKAKSTKMSTGFKHGFAVGGLLGGLESVLDQTAFIIDQGVTDYTTLTHEIFQGILLQGGIAGLTNALLTKV